MRTDRVRKVLIIGMLAVMISTLVVGCGKKKEKELDLDCYIPQVTIIEPPEPENKLISNSHDSIEGLIDKYVEAIASGDIDTLEKIVDEIPESEKSKIKSKASFIERLEDVECFTKDGPIEDSYIVFVVYEMKLIGIDTPAPDIICLYVGPKENDKRIIHYGTLDESMSDYVKELEEDPDVKALYEKVSKEYQEAQEKDQMLANFIAQISGKPAVTATNSEQGSDNKTSISGQMKNRQTRAKDTINIRAESNTDAERVAVAYKGDAITQIESFPSGWSKVEYQGKTGFCKTEFLE